MPVLITTYYKFPCLFSKRNPGYSQKNHRTRKGEPFPKKSRGILCKGSRLVGYHFIDQYKTIFGLRWFFRKFQISPNAYYNYLKQYKATYQQQKNQVKEEIKQIYYNNNRLLGHRVMRIFLLRKGIRLSKTTVDRYMNGVLILPISDWQMGE